MADCVYLKLSESCLAEKKKVRIKDVATVVSGNPDAKYDIEKMELAEFYWYKGAEGDLCNVHYRTDTAEIPRAAGGSTWGDGCSGILQDL